MNKILSSIPVVSFAAINDLDALPDEVVSNVLSHLDIKSWIISSQVSQRLRSIAHSRCVYAQVLPPPSKADGRPFEVLFAAQHARPLDYTMVMSASSGHISEMQFPIAKYSRTPVGSYVSAITAAALLCFLPAGQSQYSPLFLDSVEKKVGALLLCVVLLGLVSQQELYREGLIKHRSALDSVTKLGRLRSSDTDIGQALRCGHKHLAADSLTRVRYAKAALTRVRSFPNSSVDCAIAFSQLRDDDAKLADARAIELFSERNQN